MSKTYDDLIYSINDRHHRENSIFSEYIEGFNSHENDTNPYPFPLKINLEQIKIGCLDRCLIPEEKIRLKQLMDIMDASSWSKWSYGNFMKKLIKH